MIIITAHLLGLESLGRCDARSRQLVVRSLAQASDARSCVGHFSRAETESVTVSVLDHEVVEKVQGFMSRSSSRVVKTPRGR